MKKIIALSLSILGLFSFPAFAHEHDEHETSCSEENHESCSEDCHEECHEDGEHGDKIKIRAFLEGTPNVLPATTFKRNTFYVNFSHNWIAGDFPRGSNPAFTFTYAALDRLQVDSMISLREAPLEFEAGLKYSIFDETKDDLFSLAPRIAYNTRGNIFGAELIASKIFFGDILNVGMNYRFLSNDAPDKIPGMVHALGFNSIVRVWKDWHIFGDVVLPLNFSTDKNPPIWGTGIKKVLGDAPHVMTVYVGNTQESTISGRTVPTNNVLRVGFNYSIGITDITKLPGMIF